MISLFWNLILLDTRMNALEVVPLMIHMFIRIYEESAQMFFWHRKVIKDYMFDRFVNFENLGKMYV